MRPRGIGIDVASRFQVDSRDVSGSRRREREATWWREKRKKWWSSRLPRSNARPTRKIGKEGEWIFQVQGKTSTPRRGGLYP